MLSIVDELKSQSAQLTRGATAQAPVQHASCNAIARLDAPPDTRDGRLVLRATPLFDGPYTQAGRPETFVVRAERVKECLDNLNKGAGSGPGSILAFGNAWRDRATGDLSVGWINTCVSAQKVKGALNHHQDRRVEEVFAQMPVLDFTNVRRAAGEPERVRWPLGQDFAEARVQVGGRWQTVAFDRAWLKEKLEQAWDARPQEGVSVNLRLPVLRPEHSRAVADAAGAAAALEALLAADRYRSVLTRIGVGGAADARWQPLMRGESPAEWAARLLSKAPGFDARGAPVADPETGAQVQVDRFSLIEGIDNDVLFAAAGRGELIVEFLPRDTLLVASKNAVGLAHDVKALLQSESADDLHAVHFTFGRDPEAVSRVALVLQRHDERTYVVAGPFRLDTGPNYAPATVPSPHWQLPAAPVAADARAPAEPEPEPPLEPATVQDIPELGDDDFELDRAAIGAALDVAAPAASAPAPVEAPQPPRAPQPLPRRAETVMPAPEAGAALSPKAEAPSERPPRPFSVDDIGKTVIAKEGTGWPKGYSGTVSTSASWVDGKWWLNIDHKTGGTTTVDATEFELAGKSPERAPPDRPAPAPAPATRPAGRPAAPMM